LTRNKTEQELSRHILICVAVVAQSCVEKGQGLMGGITAYSQRRRRRQKPSN